MLETYNLVVLISQKDRVDHLAASLLFATEFFSALFIEVFNKICYNFIIIYLKFNKYAYIRRVARA